MSSITATFSGTMHEDEKAVLDAYSVEVEELAASIATPALNGKTAYKLTCTASHFNGVAAYITHLASQGRVDPDWTFSNPEGPEEPAAFDAQRLARLMLELGDAYRLYKQKEAEVTAILLPAKTSVSIGKVTAKYVSGSAINDHEGDVRRYIAAMQAQGDWQAVAVAQQAIKERTKESVSWASVVADLKAAGAAWSTTELKRGAPRIDISVAD